MSEQEQAQQVDWEEEGRLGFEDGRIYRRATETDMDTDCEVVLDMELRETFVVRIHED